MILLDGHDDEGPALQLRRRVHRPRAGATIRQVALAVAGRRRVDIDTPLRDDDTFHLGSDTKAMTASVVARLVDRGILRWDETLSEAMPGDSGMDPGFRHVTLDMLLRHVAGLPQGGAFTPEFTAGFDETWPIQKQPEWMAKRFLSRSPLQTPGTRSYGP